MPVKPIPDGYHAVTPVIISDRADEVIEFITRVFGGKERLRMPMPDGKIAHAEVEVGDGLIMVSDAMEGFPAAPARLHVYVEDVDSVYRKAIEAGATGEREPSTEFYGDRHGSVIDPSGNHWSIATHVEDVSEEETMKRMASMAQQ